MTVVSSLDPNEPKTPVQRDILMALFTPLGRCRFMDEKVAFPLSLSLSLSRFAFSPTQLTPSTPHQPQHFDAVTAVAGSGPAFVCVVLEAMADGGVMMGLPRSEALELAAQTMQGAARMVLQTGVHPAALKDSVTSALLLALLFLPLPSFPSLLAHHPSCLPPPLSPSSVPLPTRARTATDTLPSPPLPTPPHPAHSHSRLTSAPGGCTIAGLLCLEDGKLRSNMARCIQATTQHAAGLGRTK